MYTLDLQMFSDSRNPAASRPTLQVQGGPAVVCME
jgi:hypothetical protein